MHQNVIPRTSHEGIQFDKAGNMYFIDELNGGNIYKYTSAAKFGDIMSGKADYFAAGQTFVLRVGDGNTPNATGAYTWVPFTDADWRRSARSAHHHGPERRHLGRCPQHHQPGGVQGHGLPAPGGHADPDGERTSSIST